METTNGKTYGPLIVTLQVIALVALAVIIVNTWPEAPAPEPTVKTVSLTIDDINGALADPTDQALYLHVYGPQDVLADATIEFTVGSATFPTFSSAYHRHWKICAEDYPGRQGTSLQDIQSYMTDPLRQLNKIDIVISNKSNGPSGPPPPTAIMIDSALFDPLKKPDYSDGSFYFNHWGEVDVGTRGYLYR